MIRLLFLSGRESGYIRNRVLLNALRQQFEVTLLTPERGGITARTVGGLARFVARRPRYDLCIAGFYGQMIAIGLSLLQRQPLLLDAFVSTYDTLCEDRRRFGPRSPAGRLARWLDVHGCRVAARVLTDTAAHAQYFETLGVAREKLFPLYVGCDETLFYPRPAPPAVAARFEVFTYGSFLPLHGVEVVVQAAARLRDRPEIHFTIGGDGTRRPAVEREIAALGLDNVDLVGWIPFAQLPDWIASADLCLGGHFSCIAKAQRVIATKTFQFVAMQRPTVVGDNPATRELFVPGEHVWAVPMGDAAALAEAVRRLAGDPPLRRRLAQGGYQRFRERLATPVLAGQLARIVEETCASAW
ncbi:MAG: glycosyltransferase [Anaerolineae bacterium]|nr:glycosyltransferase [Anaerolineae bacterium]